MGRRGMRLTRSGNTVEAHYYTTQPSGVTIDGAKNRMDVGKIYGTSLSGTSFTGNVDFGQGTDYKIYRGVAPLSMNAPTDGTRLSDGTVQFSTGLTTIASFTFSLQSAAATAGRVGFPKEIHFTTGYKTAGGVTMFLSAGKDFDSLTGATPGGVNLAGGSTIHWVAVGE